ncbi:hypothetical protein BD770DRAFT_402049 [Pilaira anomala]|nr:hypothetical protein BD770DRAFT_402049 [Pilaira anomala]
MTAQQPSPTELFHIPAHSNDPTMLQWAHNEIQIEPKKRRRSLDDTIEKEFIPLKKSPRITDEQSKC